MKLISLAITLLATSLCFATPRVGDYAEFNLTLSQGAQKAAGVLMVAIVADQGATVTMSTTAHFEGQQDQYNEEQTPKEQLASDQVIQQVLSNCAQYGGTTEQVTTAAGTLSTCKLPLQGEQSGFQWIGAVPFGVVKQVTTDKEQMTTTLEIRKFINGQ